MGIKNLIVKTHFGEFYKIQLPHERIAQLKIKPQSFWNEESTRQFINNLTVPHGCWQDILNQCTTAPSPTHHLTVEKIIINLMIQGQLQFYPVDIPDMVEHPPENRVLKGANDILYRFAPASTLLIGNNLKTITFKNVDEAKAFISELNPDNGQLETIAIELDIAIPNTASVNSTETLDAISKALVSGNVVIIAEKSTSTPPKDKEQTTDTSANNKKAGLGTKLEKETTEKEKDHVCMLNKFTLSCKHGRSVVLDPNKAVNPKTGNAKVVYLSVTSAPKSSARKSQEVLTAKIEINDKCDSHIKAPYSITSDSVQLVNENFGDLIKFYSPGEDLNLTTEFYKYI